jgi:dihydrofolate reductase
MNARIALVAAVARNGVIGADGGLAWKISDDLKWFKAKTMNKPMIMGRKTFDSVGKALPGRDNIVLTRAATFSAGGVFIARSLDGAITLARACAEARGADEVCVIGGADIYAQTLPRAARIYLTTVEAEVEGDAYFPAYDSAQWRQTCVGASPKNEKNEHACEYFILDRKPRIPVK